MAMVRHPVTKAEYARRDDGTVVVTGIDGVSGVFDRHGFWIEGKRRSADAALCFWVSCATGSKAAGTLSATSNSQERT
jgi:hypothetical protein